MPTFDGTSSVFYFIADIYTATERIRSFCDERLIILMILSKLRGKPKKCTYNQHFKSVKDLTDFLKNRCAPKKPVEDYIDQIYNVRIYCNETLDEFNDRLRILISKMRDAWKYQNNSEIEKELITFVQNMAIKSFIRALPYHWGELVWAKKPKDLLDAFLFVKHLQETRTYRERVQYND